ncbi:TRAP transporter small permease subunit [Georgenia deserti]|uniref:TRAP transporter small permease subunit n=1 Tax=Georgenia deserti TaxID=2093781 RepID=A0ABW4L7E6_9MICO
MDRFERLVVGLGRVMGVIGALAIVVLMLAIVIDVTARYLTNASVPAMLEISESALVVAIFFGLAWAGASGAHVSVTLVSDRLPRRTNAVLQVVVWGLATALSAWLLYAGFIRALDATSRGESRMGLIQFPLWPLRWAIVAGFTAFLLVCLANLIRSLRGRTIMPEGIAEQPRTEAGGADPRGAA